LRFGLDALLLGLQLAALGDCRGELRLDIGHAVLRPELIVAAARLSERGARGFDVFLERSRSVVGAGSRDLGLVLEEYLDDGGRELARLLRGRAARLDRHEVRRHVVPDLDLVLEHVRRIAELQALLHLRERHGQLQARRLRREHAVIADTIRRLPQQHGLRLVRMLHSEEREREAQRSPDHPRERDPLPVA
jgi:hypothetical protein